jgi:hypothetical protein
MPEDYEIVAREGGGMEFRHKSGDVLLVTERVSLDTLIRLYLEDEVDATNA